MKKQSFLWLTVFITNYCLAQKYDELKNIAYYSVASARWAKHINITGDSIIINSHRGIGVKDEKRYEIAAEEKKGAYYFIYIKNEPHKLTVVGSSHPAYLLPPYYGLFVLSFSKNKDELMVLSEFGHYQQIADIKAANDTVKFEDAYFDKWYSERAFATYTAYPDIATADKATIQKVTDNWIAELTGYHYKMITSKRYDLYRINGQNILSQALIGQHLSPIGTLTDLDKKTTEYHISLPQTSQFGDQRIPPYKPVKPNSGIIIDGPVGNK
jgi:hypothetical protein